MTVYTAFSPQPQQSIYNPPPVVKSNSAIISQEKSELGYNCVEYAKSKGNVPVGMSSLEQKVSKISSQEPEVGKIGITAEGHIGHLVVVEQVKEDTLIISEGNYKHGYITHREIPKSLVLGYL